MKLLVLAVFVSSSLYASGFPIQFPKGPDAELTPGTLCTHPDEYRYPEQIPYCERDVSGQEKAQVFEAYRRLGFVLPPERRSDYKIDHLIPLCAGGSNDETNLWPQHKSVYNLTDPLETVGCEKLKVGKIKQAEVVRMILEAKNDLSLVRETFDYFKSL